MHDEPIFIYLFAMTETGLSVYPGSHDEWRNLS